MGIQMEHNTAIKCVQKIAISLGRLHHTRPVLGMHRLTFTEVHRGNMGEDEILTRGVERGKTGLVG